MENLFSLKFTCCRLAPPRTEGNAEKKGTNYADAEHTPHRVGGGRDTQSAEGRERHGDEKGMTGHSYVSGTLRGPSAGSSPL